MRRIMIGAVALAMVVSVGGIAAAKERAKKSDSKGIAIRLRIGDFGIGIGDRKDYRSSRGRRYSYRRRGRFYFERDRVRRLIYKLRYARDDDDREDAAKELGRLRARRAVGALISALSHDREDDVREQAAKALGRIGSRKAVRPLRYARYHDRSRKVRRAAKKALSKIRDDHGRGRRRGRDCDCGRDHDHDCDGPYYD